ncbi:MAG: magnesium transporter [Alphaproteobacteria bacterium]
MADESPNIALESNEDTPFLLSDREIREISEAVRAQDPDTVHAILRDLSPVDIAELIEKVTDEDRRELILMYGETMNPLVFAEMDSGLRSNTLSILSADQVAGIISRLESDDALDMILDLDTEFRQEIMRRLSAKIRLAVEEGLSFPENSAGRLMQREAVAVPQFWTVGKTIDYLREAATDLPDDFFDIFVIDPAYHVLGQIPLNRVIRSRRSVKMQDLIRGDVTAIPATMDQEEVAHLFRRGDITSAPVVDDSNRLIGVVTIDDVVDVIDEEAQEDMMKMAGVSDQGDLYRAVLSTTGTRFRWLFINLLTAIFASMVISLFDATIEQIVALAVLMPIVASMGGNAGTQSLAIAVRALATRELSGTNTWRIIWKESLVGSLNGLAFAVITGTITALWFQSPMLGLVIASAMWINLIVAGFFGACIPIILNKYGSDPAVSSTVFLTTVTDVVGFFAFLGLAAVLLF